MDTHEYDKLPKELLPLVEKIAEISNAGYVLALGGKLSGIDIYVSTYPAEWRKIYDSRFYGIRDFSALWSVTQNGSIRWSDIQQSDSTVLREAAKFDIRFGATFARFQSLKKYVVTSARNDRELTDDEIRVIDNCLDQMTDFLANKRLLSEKHWKTLSLAAQGYRPKEIADQLGISVHTVNQRLDACRKNLGAKTLPHAVSLATTRNLLTLE